MEGILGALPMLHPQLWDTTTQTLVSSFQTRKRVFFIIGGWGRWRRRSGEEGVGRRLCWLRRKGGKGSVYWGGQGEGALCVEGGRGRDGPGVARGIKIFCLNMCLA